MIVVVIAERRGAIEKRHVRPRRQRRQRVRDEGGSALAVDGGGEVRQQAAAHLRLLVGEDHALARIRRRQRRREARWAGADHQHVAMGVAVDVAVRVRRLRRHAEAGGGADGRLIELVPEGARPHEGLVVEARRQHRGDQIVHLPDVVLQRRPVVLRGHLQPRHRLHHRGAVVGIGPAGAAIHAEQRVGLVRTMGQHPARAVIFERAAHQLDAVGEQRGGEGVALIALDRASVEGEGNGLLAVDAATAGKAEILRHQRPPVMSGRGWPIS